MYGSSYIRSVTLNNGGAYADVTSNSAAPTGTLTATSTIEHDYGAFTHSSGALYKYIVAPNNMPYQTTLQGNFMNESLAVSLTVSKTFQDKSPYYTAWGNDKLWLQSQTEMGYNDSNKGLWQTSQAERAHSANVRTIWTRTCHFNYANSVYAISQNGIDSTGNFATNIGNTYNFRPALHLNLNLVTEGMIGNINLDRQDGTGTVDIMSVWLNDIMPSITVPTRVGYTFGGYYTDTNGKGVQYYLPDGTSTKIFTDTSPTTLYAKWTANTYKIVYNGNGNTGGSTSSSSHTYDKARNLNTNGYKKTGYSFAGWATGNLGAIVYLDKQSVINLTPTNGETVMLYAKWIVNTYIVTFDYNGTISGTLPSNKEVIFGSVYGDLPLQTKAGEFIQWYLDSSFVNRVIPTTFVSTAKDHTLYAKRTTWLTAQVVDISSEVGIKGSLNIEEETAKATITPANGYYISEFSFDNANFYTIDSYSKSIGYIDFALRVTYIASTKSNKVGFNFEYLDLNYLNSQSIKLYLRLTTDVYSSLKQSGGSVEGVNVTATYGGMVSMIGDDFENLADDDTVTFVANVCVDGYKFSHWENSAGDSLGTDNSIRLAKSVVMDNIIKAVFVPVDDSLINGDKNN